ncbi:membrane-spanning 4-domains subfamily A member 8 [Exaiptasia diaphana]|uniref:Uncharacterized protein n=1 Tax=Exaiptasia diaphana TaxID=2652724 RepID=A0A913X8W4_EXADI|nr:membrane-spanning 4-domains subfamily A member 8 [Exaiptasia diaphana]KXJ14078.1 hypothetical protein AC249_AIPGENE20286 [Exaiptasia diaphana]
MGFSFKYTRYSAIAQITLGVLSIVFGIADRAVLYKRYAFHSESVVPIWMGVWFVITGVIGVHGSKRSNARDGRASRPLIGTYLAFSIVSTVFAAVIIIMYAIGVAVVITKGSPCHYAGKYVNVYKSQHYRDHKYISLEKECNRSVAMGSLVIIFAILEFCVGIWASICACTNGCCDCCNPTMQQPTQMGQVIYLQTQQGPQAYIMTQSANGVSVAVPAMVPGQVQMSAVPAPTQAMYPSPAVAPGGGAQGVGTLDAQAPPLHPKSGDMPPVYQP